MAAITIMIAPLVCKSGLLQRWGMVGQVKVGECGGVGGGLVVVVGGGGGL